ncbi:hypothetical protein CLAFUW4_13193 [Fulvia fulva]|uniref:Uncharacterized protein n=1 Tax=Passalora fulva TaxID=5499 RepID=A0A9Q8PJG6_PASFU|nr:uncharacterized protein CLAFUR5_13050 [Fulvia fulva]KAK4611683.1 hypothetical protein CLAFUR4_13198 [Fulvia fulva]UJO23551.1 hypothetical protein CLAFUR5_13050 [Fulvia fulva]WPV21271.1 hypothetical protein CLAFUW4_13193 [Fulvia fulva]WPV36235.1 hypothetical protein CLAFUW7_13201 [Fulvia fulva]
MVPPGCTLGDLPVELVLRFLAPVIPDGHIFHLGPHQHEVKGVQPRYVHQIVALPNDDPTVCLSELALCGRKVKEVVYALFYGRNQFVLELAAVSHGAHVAVSKTFHATSWNRIVHSRPDTLPLSHDILLYVKDLTISIGLTYGGGTIRERGAIKAQLQELADAFVDQDHALKKITVGLTTLKQVDKRWTSNNLKLKYGLPNVAMRLALARFSNRQAAMLREAIASMLMPLTQLSDVEVEVVVNGKGS